MYWGQELSHWRRGEPVLVGDRYYNNYYTLVNACAISLARMKLQAQDLIVSPICHWLCCQTQKASSEFSSQKSDLP